MREAEKIIEDNKHLVQNDDDSQYDDEVEEMEDLNASEKGFHFNSKPASSKPTLVQPLSNKKPAALSAVTPLNIGPQGGDSKTYGKKIGFTDDFDDDWDETSRKQEDEQESDEDWEGGDYGL